MFKNYVWDFDGMLFDSYPHITMAFKKAMADFGTEVDFDEAKRLLEVSYATAFDYYKITDGQKARFFDYEHDVDLEPVVVPFANTVETIKKIHLNGCKNYLYTHRGENAFYYLKKYGLYDFFDGFVTSENGFPLKPCPDAMNYIINEYSLNREETVMVGDREIDVMAGKNAGAMGCLFTLEKKDTQADFVIDDIIKTLDLEV